MPRTTPRRRSNGEGSLYQTKDGLWRGAVVYTEASTGRVMRRYVSAKTQTHARERLTAVRRDLDLGNMPVTGAQSVGDFIDTWLLRIPGVVGAAAR